MNRIKIICLVASTLMTLAAQAQGEKFVIKEGPYLQNVQSDEFTVVWKSSARAMAWAEIAPEDGLHFNGAERERYYDTRIGQHRVDTLHRVRITGLKSGTTYRYRIYQQKVDYNPGGGVAMRSQIVASEVYRCEPYRVTTADPAKESVRFMVLNDIHGRDSLFRIHAGHVEKEGYDFVILNGDMTSFMRTEIEIFDGYLRSASEMFATDIPFYMVRGNHETRGEFAINYMDYFPTSTDEPYYTFRQGPVFFIVLDGGEDKPDRDIEYYGLAHYDAYRSKEAEWLAGVIGSREFMEAPVKIVIIHMPPVQSGWYGPKQVAKFFGPLLQGKGIDLMLCGHTHRESFDPAGEVGFDFPILINANENRIEVGVDGQRIELRTVTPKGKTSKQIEL